MSQKYLAEANKIGTGMLCPVQETLRQRLVRQHKELTERLSDVNEALKLLDANPSLEDFHNAIQKTGW